MLRVNRSLFSDQEIQEISRRVRGNALRYMARQRRPPQPFEAQDKKAAATMPGKSGCSAAGNPGEFRQDALPTGVHHFRASQKKGEPLGPPRFLFADYRYVIFGISIARFNPQPLPLPPALPLPRPSPLLLCLRHLQLARVEKKSARAKIDRRGGEN